MAARITTNEILALLEAKHEPPEWAFLRELRAGTGYAFRDRGRKVRSEMESRMDAWAINHWSSRHRQRVAYEIKTNRADFAREIRQPLKRRAALLLSNLFYFVAPDGVIPLADVPPECGLLVVVKRPIGLVGKRPIGLVLKEDVPAAWRDTPPPPWHFVSALARRINKGNQGERES